jgi:hypothetical protein
VATTVYVLNRSPTQSVDSRTPYEVWHDIKPKVHHLRTFGCITHVKQGNKQLTKLDDQSTPMVFLGYEPGCKACRFYNPVTKCVHMSCIAVFEEDRPWKWSSDNCGVQTDDKDSFTVEHVIVHGTRVEPTGISGSMPVAPSRASSVRSEESPTRALTPDTPQSPTTPDPVEFMSPPATTSDLDSEADDVPRRFHVMQNILGQNLVSGLADRESWRICWQL